MTAPHFTYDLDTHQFWVDGVRAWGITSALAAAGRYGDMDKIPPFYRDRGKATALAIELHECGDLDPDSLDEHTKPPLEQWCRFCDKEVDAVLGVEFFTWAMAGDVPFVVIIDALVRMRKDGRLRVIDVKRGKNKPVYGLQTAAQETALRAELYRSCDMAPRHISRDEGGFERGVLELTDRDYRWVPHTRATDYDEVLGLISKLGPREDWKKEETA